MSSDSDELLYVKGERVWIPHAENVWESVTIEQNYKQGDNEILSKKDSGDNYIIKLHKELPPLCNPGILSGQRNLVSLSYLHEPAVLHNLEVRFRDRQNIYTYCGIVLVAINPYADLPLYGPDIIRSYRGHSHNDLDPHIFAVADEAYAKLEREKSNISIIISGESGAGKTVSAKYAMRYFAAVGGSESETKIEKKVLASSPIMEAIGNAKTTKNDNSSRFGKFTKLLFKNKSHVMSLVGASMQTYLLEKSRVVFQSTDERNYHIFYQLCSGRKDYPELKLDSASSFNYLNQGGSTEIYKVSDTELFRDTLNAFTTLGFKKDEMHDILRILSGILHLGNIDIISKTKAHAEADQDACEISIDNMHLRIVGDLFQINLAQLRQYLITRQIVSASDVILIPNDILTAENRRNALAKHLYEKLFHYIVYGINKTLNKNKDDLNNFIGVLDIYGFEAFESNSFEQFCINYANEKLQQQFNQHVFKLEQEEYLKEGITWTMIDFYDNQPCIDLIESKLGILDLLDEECKMPKGSDSSWADKLVNKCGKYHHFEKPRFGKKSFMIKHFSDTVEYDVNGFLEKNRDTVSKELVNVFYKSKMKFCQNILEYDPINYVNDLHSENHEIVKSRPQQNKKTVGFQFRENLSALISTLHLTIPNYVRCIKPNENKDPFKWESKKIVQQLRACGVLETVRISAAGFPSRWLYTDFYERYRLLYSFKRSYIDLNKRCIQIVRTHIPDADKYRFGNKKIFFRAGQVAYLEQIRSNLRKKYIIIVQSVVRRFIYRKRYLKLYKTTLGIQSFSRGLLARRKAQSKRENKAAILIQTNCRRYLCRKRYLELKDSVSRLQKYARGMLARRKYKLMLENYNATLIQKYFRGYRARKEYKRKLNHIVLVQSVIRAYLARKVFKKMRTEARTISHIQKQYKGLENKIISMQQTIDDLNKENNQLKTRNMEIPNLRSQLDLKKKLEEEVKTLKSVLNTMSKNLEIERDEKMSLLEEKDREYNKWLQQKQGWRVENDVLKKEIYNMIEMAKNNYAKRQTETNDDEIHYAYQTALKDKEILEIQNQNLLEKIKCLKESEKENHSLDSNILKHNDEDFGYGSAKNTLKKLNGTSDLEKHSSSLIIRLKNLHEEEKNRRVYLEKQVERIEMKKSIKSIHQFNEDSFRISDLEMENDKLRHDHEALRSSITHNKGVKELEEQYVALQEELKRQRDESIQLKTVLLEQSKLLGSFNNNNGDGPVKGETNEPMQALKHINRQLEAELLALNQENNARLEELTKQIEHLKSENESLNKIIYSKIDCTDELNVENLKQIENYLRSELEKCLTDYILLQEQNNELVRTVDNLSFTINILRNKLKTFGVTDEVLQEENKNLLPVKKKSKKYQGIFKYANKDLNKILKKLVSELLPRTAINLLPGLPSYILFMCIRYTDLINADDQVRDLLTNFLKLTNPAYRKPNTTEVRVLWLVNLITLLNLLKQYGGLDEYTLQNTETQKQQILKNFDLSEYRSLIYETILRLYNVLTEQIQETIKPYIVAAVLEHNEISLERTHNKIHSSDISPKHPAEPKSLTHHLNYYYKQFEFFGLNSNYISQIFKQLMYYICAVAMNRLMLRGELCMWRTGMKIRYSYRCLEEWAREKGLPKEVLAPMAPLNQVSSLLQARKSETDVDSAYELCSNLSTAQVHKLLKSYRPDDLENSISKVFIEKLVEKIDENNEKKAENGIFTIEENFIHTLKVSFDYSKIKLEDIELPPSLHLNEFLCKI